MAKLVFYTVISEEYTATDTILPIVKLTIPKIHINAYIFTVKYSSTIISILNANE